MYGAGGGGYPGGQPAGGGGYPGAQRGGYQGGGYPGAQAGGGGYPGGQAGGGGYPGAGAPPGGGYGGASAPPGGGYGGAAPPGGGYGGAAPPGGGYGGAAPPGGGYGGYQQQPQVRPEIMQWFQAVDTDRSGQITTKELQQALTNGNWSNFSEEACRMMISMFDRDNSGSINVTEFQGLFDYINQWRSSFAAYDQDRSGNINFNELKQVYQGMGYRFTDQFVNLIISKYDPSKKRVLTLDNFIVSCVTLKNLTDAFRKRDSNMSGTITVGYEDFLNCVFTSI